MIIRKGKWFFNLYVKALLVDEYIHVNDDLDLEFLLMEV